VLQRRRRHLAAITGKAFFNDPKLRLVGKPTPAARADDLKAAHCPKTVLIPVHKDKTTDSQQPIKAAALGCLRFRHKFERYIAKDRDNPDLRRKALTAITAKMARVVHAVIKSGSDYRPFVEGRVPGGRTSLS